jgi:hypothetical protein
MTGIGGTPPLSPRKPAQPSQEFEPRTPRRLDVTKTSPRSNFPITRAEAVERRKREKETEAKQPENVAIHENDEFRIVIRNELRSEPETERAPEVELVQVETVIISPRRGINEELPMEEQPKPIAENAIGPSQGFREKLRFFENLPQAGTTTTTTPSTATTLSVPPLRPLPQLPSQESAETVVTSPRRDAIAALPPVTPREPEKKT